jgi:hypothetical protein
MKNTLFLLLLVVLASCQESNFKVGDCIQKPDSMIVHRLDKIENGKAYITTVHPRGEAIPREIALSSDWIVTACP